MRVGTSRRAAIALVVPLALLVGVTGCSSPATSTGAHPSAARSTGNETTHDGTVTHVTHAPGTTKGYVGAVKDVELTSCSADTAPARFAGSVTNPTATTQSYRIYVSLQSEHATVGVKEVDIGHLGAHATQDWSGSLPVGKAGTTCVLRVERNG
jgi:hypothetical protein